MRCDNLSDCRRAHSLVRLLLFRITAAVTGPPPKHYDLKARAIGGSRSPHGYPTVGDW